LRTIALSGLSVCHFDRLQDEQIVKITTHCDDSIGMQQAPVRARLRGHRVEAPRFAVPRWTIGTLTQAQEPGVVSREARGRRGVPVKTALARRIVWAIIIGVVLIILAVGILVFVDATAIPDEAKRCAPSVWQSQWPRYLGCAMAAHEGLARARSRSSGEEVA
jgi:hypothetical protein